MDKINIKGVLSFKIVGADGTLKDAWTVNNTITNTGKAAFAGLVGNVGSVSAFTYIALGSSNTAPAASQTALGSEISTNGFARAAATVTRSTTTQTNDTLQFDKTFTASGSSTIEEIGFFNAASTGIMGGRALTTTKTLVSGDQLVTTYKVIFS